MKLIILLDKIDILLISLAILVVLLGVLVAFVLLKRKNSSSKTPENAPNEDSGEVDITLNKDDIILSRGQTYKIDDFSLVKPQRYQVFSTETGVEKFNIRVAGFVKEYNHGDYIILVSGDEITSVSHNVILR